MQLNTLITTLLLAILATSVALYDAVTGDVSDWLDTVDARPCVCIAND